MNYIKNIKIKLDSMLCCSEKSYEMQGYKSWLH